MTKKKSKKKKRQQKKMIITIAGVVILVSAATAGILFYKKLTSHTREQAIQEYMGYIEKKEYDKMYELLDENSKQWKSMKRISMKVLKPQTFSWIYRKNRIKISPCPTG